MCELGWPRLVERFALLWSPCVNCVFKSNLIKSLLYSLYYAEACNELAGLNSASMRPRNTASFEEMSQRWRVVGNTVSDLTRPRFVPQTSRSRNESVTARPAGRYCVFHMCIVNVDFSCLRVLVNE